MIASAKQIGDRVSGGGSKTQQKPLLVHRLAYNGDVAAGQLAVFQGGPSRTGGKVPVSGLIRVERVTRKNSQLAAAQRFALKNGPAAALLVGYVPPQFFC